MENNRLNGGSDSVCRLCLSDDCVRTIFTHDSIDIASVVKFTTQLEVTRDDAHTKFICGSCTEFVENIVEFRERCIESYNVLLKQLDATVPVVEYLNECDESHVEDDLRLEFIKCESRHAEVLTGNGENVDNVSFSENGALRIPEHPDLLTETTPVEDETYNSDVSCEQIQAPLSVQNRTNSAVCPLCGEHFVGGKTMVNYHMKSDHGEDEALPKIRQCLFCPKAYSSYQLLKYHLNFHPQKVWQCPQCDKKIEKKATFIDHLRIHADERYYECKTCDKRFTTMKYLSTHRQLHKLQKTPEKKVNPCQNEVVRQEQFFQCSICPESFHNHTLLNIHLECDHVPQVDVEGRCYSCNVCKKSYFSINHLNVHMQLHDLLECWSCANCAMKFKSKTDLQKHQKSHNQHASYLCIHCGREFPTSRYLNRHILSHKKENPPIAPEMYECEICGKQMKFKSNYTNHRKSHKNVTSMQGETDRETSATDVEQKKVYLCNVCGHNCGSSSNLVVHLRRHNGKSICQCSVCGKGYPRKSDLVMHMRIHTGEKPFECSFCGKGFSRRDKLRIHIRTHTGEKPYDCPCGRAYAQKNDLKTHQKRNICGQNFDMSKLLAPYSTSICIKSPNRSESPARALSNQQIGKVSGSLMSDSAPAVSKEPTELLGAGGSVVDMSETPNWSHFMAVTFPKQGNASIVDFENVAFTTQTKLYS